MKSKIVIAIIVIAIILLDWLNEETNGLIFALSLGVLVLYAATAALSGVFNGATSGNAKEESKKNHNG